MDPPSENVSLDAMLPDLMPCAPPQRLWEDHSYNCSMVQVFLVSTKIILSYNIADRTT